jgi:predicted kinase
MTSQQLYIICGNPAAGKSTYARKLAQKTGACLLDSDIVSETLIGTSLKTMGRNPDDRDSAFYKSTFRIPVYETLYKIARQNLAFNSVIIAAPFTKEIRNPDWKIELEAKFGVLVEIIYIQCSPEINYQRMKKRAAKRDEAKLKDWETYLKYYSGDKPPACEHTMVDTLNSLN